MSEQSEMHLHKKGRHVRENYVEFQLTQHDFQSERESTNHSLDAYSTSSLHSLTADSARDLHFNLHINNPIREIMFEFKERLKERGFKCSEVFSNQMYLVRLTKLDKVKKLFWCVEPPKYILSIRTHEFKSVRTVFLKPISKFASSASQGGQSAQVGGSKVDEEVCEILQDLKMNCKMLNKPMTSQEQEEMETEYTQDIYSLDATSDYMYSKMLVDSNYSMGRRMGVILGGFQAKDRKGVVEAKISELIWLNEALGELTKQMLEGFNCSRKELYEILCYCRKSVQNYFYSSVQQNIVESSSLENTRLTPEKDYEPNSLKKQSGKEIQIWENFKCTYNQLQQLQSSECSIEIFRHLFLLVETIKIESTVKKTTTEEVQSLKEDIRRNHSAKIRTKIKCLRAAGFPEKCIEGITKDLQIDD